MHLCGNALQTVRMADGQTLDANHVISTMSAKQFGNAIKTADEATGSLLQQFNMQSIVVANFLFQGDQL